MTDGNNEFDADKCLISFEEDVGCKISTIASTLQFQPTETKDKNWKTFSKGKDELYTFIELYTIIMGIIAYTLKSKDITTKPSKDSIKALTIKTISKLPKSNDNKPVLSQSEYMNNLHNLLNEISDEIKDKMTTSPPYTQTDVQINMYSKTLEKETEQTEIIIPNDNHTQTTMENKEDIPGEPEPQQPPIDISIYNLDIRNRKKTQRNGKFSYLPKDHKLPENHEEIAEMHGASHATLNRSGFYGFAWCLTICTVTCMALFIFYRVNEVYDAWVTFCVFWCVCCCCYWTEGKISGTGEYIQNIYEKDEFLQELERIIAEIATIKCDIVCSHQEKTGSNDDSNKTVVTLRESKEYNIDYCKDISVPFNEALLEQHPLIKLTVHKIFKFKDDASEKYFYHNAEKFRLEYDRDKDQSFCSYMVLNTMVGKMNKKENERHNDGASKILIKRNANVSTSAIDENVFFVATCCLFGACYRSCLAYKTKKMEYVVYKEISLKVNDE
eukprot:239032_1